MNNPFLSRYVWLQKNISVMHHVQHTEEVANSSHVQYLKPMSYIIQDVPSTDQCHMKPRYPDTPALPCPACDTVLERPMCCHGSGAPAIPSMIAISTCSRKKTCSPPKHCFHINIFTGMCVRMYVCVGFFVCGLNQSMVVSFFQQLQEEINGRTSFFWGVGEGVVVCVCLCAYAALQAFVLAFLSYLQFILFLRGNCTGDKRGEGK